jgi:predicted HTH domain antitoxin
VLPTGHASPKLDPTQPAKLVPFQAGANTRSAVLPPITTKSRGPQEQVRATLLPHVHEAGGLWNPHFFHYADLLADHVFVDVTDLSNLDISNLAVAGAVRRVHVIIGPIRGALLQRCSGPIGSQSMVSGAARLARGTEEKTMGTVQVELGEELLELLQSLDRPVQQSARELIILELYRQGRIAAGKAAELLGMGRSDFLQVASQAGVPYFEMTTQEWNEEISESRKI